MLIWIYCGEISLMPEQVIDVFDLMLIADEYFLMDLKKKCEDDMILKLDESNLLDLIILCERHASLVSPELYNKSKTLFIENFDKILKLNPNLEHEIISFPGLMTKLFSHIHNNKKNKKRKVTFVFEENFEEN